MHIVCVALAVTLYFCKNSFISNIFDSLIWCNYCKRASLNINYYYYGTDTLSKSNKTYVHSRDVICALPGALPGALQGNATGVGKKPGYEANETPVEEVVV